MQYFQKLIQKDLGFTHIIGDPIPSHDRADLWGLHRGTAKDNGDASLVFHFDPSKTRSNASLNQSLAKTGLMRLKTLRHPDVLKYLTSVEGSDGTMYIATEPATPLATVLADRSTPLDRETVQWGLFTVARALGFMHTSGLIHGRVNASTIFVTPTGDWKLGGLECVTPHASAASLAQAATALQGATYQSPELSHSNWSSVAAAAPSAVDSWALGCLMYEAHAGSLTSPDQLQNINAMPKALHSAYQKLLASNPSARAPAGQLPNHPYFQNSKFVELNMFVENLALKGQLEREAFLSKLPTVMDRLPDGFCTFKILPMLSQSMETGTGGSAAFACIVKMKDRLSLQDFGKNVVHKYAMAWLSNQAIDRNLRAELYSNLSLFTEHIDDSAINTTVFPAMSTAFQDMQAPALRDAAVKSVLSIVERLTEKNLNSVLMSHFARLQVDPEPAIRTNTTVCLGKIAPRLSQVARNKVLAAAFIRSLKDPFPPARAAGVNAIIVTTEYYGVKDIATRIMPAVVPLLVDASGEVRRLSLRVVMEFTKKLERNHEELSRVEEATAGTAGPEAQNGTPVGTGNNTSSGGWGLSSFTSMTAALLSKTDSSAGSAQISKSTSTGISSEDYRQGRVSSAVTASAAATNSSSLEHTNGSSVNKHSADAWASSTGAPSSVSLTNSAAGSAKGSVGSFADLSAADGTDEIDEEDDDDGWGDMDVKPASKEVNDEDLLASMLGQPGAKKSSAPGGVAPAGSAARSAAKNDGGDLWDLAPPILSKPKPRPPVPSSTLGGMNRTSGLAGRRPKASGGDDWSTLLGGTGTSTRRKPAGRGAR